MKKITLIAAAALVALSGVAQADVSRKVGRATKIQSGNSSVMPAEGYSSQWWTHPIGCEYSRAGRPGEIVWYLIINTARPGCPTYIVQRGFSDVY
ncbi:hypothetical protein SAMN04487859_11331 [Roseovarius lutimaris]|uniref:Uncharacterized protein n=1 Tax=Roseovarius lutimaris TaxID=1005928 RepID=A0A1I5DQC2_9RHOB|nr:hypothetical protein [Roseovarius lutimaris]SFO00991.1 hypothetical protein SAMN04487859_11331 [Roseovarius lutimaris]